MSNHEQDCADLLLAWPAAEGRITYLYELDPTHAVAQSTDRPPVRGAHARPLSGTASNFCALTESRAAAVLLELDPTHRHAG